MNQKLNQQHDLRIASIEIGVCGNAPFLSDRHLAAICSLHVTVLLLALLSIPAAAYAAAAQKANIAHATLSARLAPLWIAQEQGFFLKNGINAEVVLVRSGAALIAGIASGDIHLGSIGAGTALGAAASGMDLTIIANFASKASVELVARPGIKSAEDLKGKRFGIQSHGGTLWLYTMMTLEHLGLDTACDRILLQVVGDVISLGARVGGRDDRCRRA